MTQDDVLFGFRLQLFALAARTTVANACRTFGVHRSTYYRWKAQVDRQGLEMLRPRERRRRRCPTSSRRSSRNGSLRSRSGTRASGRGASRRARAGGMGRLRVSPNGVWKVLRRHGISTRAPSDCH